MRFTELPPAFREYMKALLGEEYEAYERCFDEKRLYGLRINTGKADAAGIKGRLPFSLSPVPWTDDGFYYEEEDRPSKHPFYYAGLYYLQEPSAMAPAALLPVSPGDRVLDLCAAPGGKSTELGAKLKGKGLLFSNDISNSRAKALLKNLELFGIPNLCVTSETPEKLAEKLPGFFDAVLVDAPCSGEGMFRKDDAMVKDWLEKGPEFYAPIQKQIILSAASMVRPGGYLLYSTCTFSRMENEEVIEHLLNGSPEMKLEKLPGWEGTAPGIGLEGPVRLFPHRIRGEGHFIALLRKKEDPSRNASSAKRQKTGKKEAIPESAKEFLASIKSPLFENGSVRMIRDCLYLIPEDFPENTGFRYLRTGLFLGTVKKDRFEPSQPLAMAIRPEEFPCSISFSQDDPRLIRYLKGETIALTEKDPGKGQKGWCLVCAEEFPLGWGKLSGDSIKNKYYPGWRWQ